MKINYFFNGRFPTDKAHGVQIAKMCEAFALQGAQVTLVTAFRRDRTKLEDYGVKNNFNILTTWSWDPRITSERMAFWVRAITGSWGFFWYLLKERYSVDTIYYARDFFSLFLLSFLGYRPVAEIHDFRFSKKRWAINFILNHAKKIIVNSEGTKSLILGLYEIPENKFLIAHNGVDLDFFNISETRDEARTKLGFPLQGRIISYVGKLETVGMDKGVELLTEACKSLQKRFPDVLMQVVHNVPHKIIPLYLRAFDVMVIPFPAYKQFAVSAAPLKVFEFLAAGKVIVASDLPALRRYLNDNNAIFFEPGNIKDLERALTQALTNPGTNAEHALQDAQQYSWQKRAKRILEFIHGQS